MIEGGMSDCKIGGEGEGGHTGVNDSAVSVLTLKRPHR